MAQDHKPELEAERQRIEGLGGFVSYIGCWRAMGILAMSRAIGDLFLKPCAPRPPRTSFAIFARVRSTRRTSARRRLDVARAGM